jgi:hypothetical protein
MDKTQLLALLDEAYDKKSWHGTNLRGSLRGVDEIRAAWRPAPGRHNIWEIALHAAYWKYAVRRRLTGAKRGSFALKGSNWFPRPDDASSWPSALRLLALEHRQLRAAVSAAKLNARSTHLIRGAAAHDFYHAGQIQLLKRLHAAQV